MQAFAIIVYDWTYLYGQAKQDCYFLTSITYFVLLLSGNKYQLYFYVNTEHKIE